MRLRGLRVLVLLVPLHALAACFALEGFSGGSGTDGGSDAPGDGAPLLPNDAAADPDADAGPAFDGDAGTPDFCGTAPMTAFFCNDFDRDPFDQGWVAAGSGFAPSPSSSLSPPRSLAVTLPGRNAGAPRSGLARQPPLGTPTVTLSFDLRIVDSEMQEAVDLGTIALQGNPYYAINLRYSHAKGGAHVLTFFEFGGARDAGEPLVRFDAMQNAPKIGDYFHVVMKLAMTDASSSVRFELDGTAHAYETSAHLYQASPLGIIVGVSGSDGAGAAFEGYVDNVLVGP